MDKFMHSEYTRMSEALQQAGETSANNLQRSEQSFQIIEATMKRIKLFITEYSFKDQGEEIRFFKETKPQFLRELLYHKEVFYIEAHKPVADKEVLAAYYKKEIERLWLFFDRNQLLYMYYRMGKTDYDSSLFVREAPNVFPLPEYAADIDSRFCTVGSYKLSKIQAYEQLKEYLESCIIRLTNSFTDFSNQDKKKPNLKWTDPKVDLIELVYAIHSKGAINYGEVDVKQIAGAVEQAFNVDLGNHSAVYNQNIRIRKKNRTAGLDQFKEYLVKRMDDADLNPR